MMAAGAAVPPGLLDRIRSECLEIPGLRLAPNQAARLWAIDASLSRRILDGLVDGGFLHKTRDGAYIRPDVLR